MVKGRNTAKTGGPAAFQKHKKRGKNGTWDRKIAAPADLIAKPVLPKSKHHSYFEFAENADKKKKKIEFEVTDKKEPSANFTFVPVGNPELTHVCKELSREQGALIYIVSGRKEQNANIGEHVHRIGYHFRSAIVEQAAAELGDSDYLHVTDPSQYKPTKDIIPESQDEINKQADAAIRDLFPRIPNTDREMIIQHAFQKGAVFNGKPVVGLQEDLSLSRRVQLAVIAHIRHNHTRYDLLLRETSWENARRAVESLCLDILVKWRGDEETGRDQLDEVLREIVVISDSEEDSSEDDDDEESDEEGEVSDESSDEVVEILPAQFVSRQPSQPLVANPQSLNRPPPQQAKPKGHSPIVFNPPQRGPAISCRTRSKANGNKPSAQARKAAKARGGFKRREAWTNALRRRGAHRDLDAPTDANAGMSVPTTQMTGTAQVNGFQRTLLKYDEDSESSTNEQGRQRQPTKQTQSPLKRLSRPPSRSYMEHDRVRPSYSIPYNGMYDTNRVDQTPISNLQGRSNEGPHAYAQPSTSRSFAEQSRYHKTPIRDLQDMPLPSIEPVIDASAPGNYLGVRPAAESSQFAEVRYQPQTVNGDERPRPLPSRQEVIYIDGEQLPAKRRRVLEGDYPSRPLTYGGDEINYPGSRPAAERYMISVSGARLAREAEPEDRVYSHDPRQNPIYDMRQPPRPAVSDMRPVRRLPDDQGPSLRSLSLHDPPPRQYPGGQQVIERQDNRREPEGQKFMGHRGQIPAPYSSTSQQGVPVELHSSGPSYMRSVPTETRYRTTHDYQNRIVHEPIHSMPSSSNLMPAQPRNYSGQVSSTQSSLPVYVPRSSEPQSQFSAVRPIARDGYGQSRNSPVYYPDLSQRLHRDEAGRALVQQEPMRQQGDMRDRRPQEIQYASRTLEERRPTDPEYQQNPSRFDLAHYVQNPPLPGGVIILD